MSKVRFILVVLICESPAILLWDGLITQALVTGAVAAAMMITARALRPDETKFFVSIIRPLAVTAAVPALWIVMQVLPLRALAHPMWKSAETALGQPLADTISIDLGVSVLALGQYLSTIAVVFLSAAIAVDRRRAEWLLFALTGACTLIGLIVLIHVSFPSGSGLPRFVPAPAIDCAAIGTIIASAAGIRAIERYETRRSSLPPPTANFPGFKRRSGDLYFGVAARGNTPSAYSSRMWLRDARVDKSYTPIRALRTELHGRHCARSDRCNFSHHRSTGRTREYLTSCLRDVVIGHDNCERTHAR